MSTIVICPFTGKGLPDVTKMILKPADSAPLIIQEATSSLPILLAQSRDETSPAEDWQIDLPHKPQGFNTC